jgi:hypothetical protein
MDAEQEGFFFHPSDERPGAETPGRENCSEAANADGGDGKFAIA